MQEGNRIAQLGLILMLIPTFALFIVCWKAALAILLFAMFVFGFLFFIGTSSK